MNKAAQPGRGAVRSTMIRLPSVIIRRPPHRATTPYVKPAWLPQTVPPPVPNSA